MQIWLAGAALAAAVALGLANFARDMSNDTVGLTLWAACALCSAVALGSFGLGLWRWKQGSTARENVRVALGEFLLRGQGLLRRCADESEPPPEDGANMWTEEVDTYLSEHLGIDYVARFRSSAGLPLAVTTIMSRTRADLWNGVRTRVARLTQFLEELAAN